MMWFVIIHVALIVAASVLWGIRESIIPIDWKEKDEFTKQYAQIMVLVLPILFIILVLPPLVAHWIGGDE